MQKIGKYLTYDDVVKSDMSKRLGIINAPNDIQIANIEALVKNVYDVIVDELIINRSKASNKLGFNSFFRTERLNAAIKGAKNSQHCTGEAIDIDADIYCNVTNQAIFTFILNRLNFDQLIAEDIDASGNIGWVHVSYNKSKNRKQALVMIKVKGKPKYYPFDEEKGFVSSNYLN